MIRLWKSDILSYIEYRTPAIYHAAAAQLRQIDSIQERFVSDLGLSALDALVHFKLAPLRSRRDIALLGMIHRSVLGLGPEHFHQYIRPPWRWQTRHAGQQRHRFHLEGFVQG